MTLASFPSLILIIRLAGGALDEHALDTSSLLPSSQVIDTSPLVKVGPLHAEPLGAKIT